MEKFKDYSLVDLHKEIEFQVKENTELVDVAKEGAKLTLKKFEEYHKISIANKRKCS